MNKQFPILLILALTTIFVGCKEDEDDSDGEMTINYNIPETYNFENVSFAGQTDRLNHLSAISDYVKSANDGNVVLDAQKLKDMYANTDDNGGGHFDFTSTKQLKSKTFEPEQAAIEEYFDKVATVSESTMAGSNGQAGSLTSGSKTYLFDENGLEYAQLIEKGLMGSCFYYQITSVYLSNDRVGNTVDNETIEAGEGTPMEHHWDEAFGYLGLETDFNINDEGRFLGKYILGRNDVIQSGDKLKEAFTAGRAAISNNDLEEKDKQRAIIYTELEKAIAGTAIHYLNGSIEDFGDDVLRNHQMSEAWAFIDALFYSPNKTITSSEIEGIQLLLGDNFYEATILNLTAARDQLAAIMDLESVKTQL